ncbi:glycosyltransferase [Ilyomonas limi]|uniref:Glycosyltransferase n=1 Tax=Ilyomonas limi TaxID=2575867 RepID=A0A4V6XAX3_9BACT|nr:TIGR04283 family arsenosugar biosynthesis glycosyltransferase [Ilyomonas limi]TKK70253.1 glycosyltransferase [Ilyomonas limi]
MISIIIPAYNEEAQIAATIAAIRVQSNAAYITEIIVADGGSSDGTVEAAKAAGAVAVVSPAKGRAAQMNYGASMAKGKILYFLHADTLPATNFTTNIINAIDKGFEAGCFMLTFNHAHWFLKANCWFTRFDVNAVRFGDQSLFITKEKFIQAGGFCEKHIVMEDQEIIKRIKKICCFTVIKKPVITSARKYLENGIYKTQGIFFIIYFMYQLGYPQQTLVNTYRRLIRQDKL